MVTFVFSDQLIELIARQILGYLSKNVLTFIHNFTD